MESELEQDEHPLEAEDDISEDDDSSEAPISLNILRQQIDEVSVGSAGSRPREGRCLPRGRKETRDRVTNRNLGGEL